MGYEHWDEQIYRREICEVGKRLYDQFFVAGNDGNISVRLDEERILITPSGVSKGRMRPEYHIVMTLDGVILDAPVGRVPSSEYRMHAIIYRNRPEVRAVVHAHPPTATGLAIAGVGLDRPFVPEAVVRNGTTPCVPYVIPGGDELPESIVPYVKEHLSLLLGNHGVVAYTDDLWEAQALMETVELNARMFLAATLAGNVNYLTDEQIDAVLARYT